MKIILGDNQFFGINHSDLQKGKKTQQMFGDKDSIKKFIKKSLTIGLDGFMINSNKLGYDVVSDFTTNLDKGDADDKEFQKRLKISEQLLKEREIAVKEGNTAPQEAPQPVPQPQPQLQGMTPNGQQ